MYSTFDLRESFYQVNCKKSSRMLTAFTANHTQDFFNKMVMGLLALSSQFADMMDCPLANIPLEQLTYFLDDPCFGSYCMKSHIDRFKTRSQVCQNP